MIYVKIAITIVMGLLLIAVIVLPFCIKDRDDQEGK